MCNIEVVWYGERGVVNSIVDGLRRGGLSTIQEFLRTIQWLGGKCPAWINDIKRVKLIVEIGLGQFGDPDLIVVCNTGDEQPYVVFVEAKVIPYRASAEIPSPSRINRQLTLKYRFAQALSRWGKEERTIEESETSFLAYARPPESSDIEETRPEPRYLVKPEVLQICRDAEFPSMPIERCYFVAMTWDRAPFFSESDFATLSIRPVFLNNDGTECLSSAGDRLGWIGYGTIDDSPRLKEDFGEPYQRALRSMIPTPHPPEIQRSDVSSLEEYRSHNVQSFATNTIQQLSALEVILRLQFGEEAVKRSSGSTSVTLFSKSRGQSKVMLKVMPRNPGSNEHLVLGVSVDFQRTEFGDTTLTGPVAIGSGRNKQPFVVIKLLDGNQGLSTAKVICDELAQMIKQDDEEQ